MKTLLMSSLGAILLAGCTTLAVPSKDAPQLLDARQVTAAFSGNTVRSYNRSRKINTYTYYAPDGSVLQERFWEVRKGRWQVMPDGQICLVFKKKSCRFIGRVGDKLYKYRRSSTGQLKPIIRYSDFTAGNYVGL
ncbi:hypothetical protein [Pseudomonas sp. MBLB4136]|uniref:hypothetical protein n=1 Tax=Pseudomonas sp. MBLB4136 TaxID=3451558 RepID=UPI003F753662